MEIGGIKAMDSMQGGQAASVRPVDSVSKSIQNEISNAQRKVQELSSKEDISIEEKTKKIQELQQEISSLNTQLRQRQAELRREQQKEAAADEMRADAVGVRGIGTGEKREDTDTKESTEKKSRVIPQTGMQSMVGMDTAMKQVDRNGAVITRMEDGIVILKGEIRQDEARGVDTTKKQEELEKREERVRRASESQFSALGEAGKRARESMRQEKKGDDGRTVSNPKMDNDGSVIIKATNYSKEKNRDEQQFYVSVGR